MPSPFIRYSFQQIKNILWHLPKSIFYFVLYYRSIKKLTLIGITGTDGKTTTATLIHQVLINAGFHADLITTINSPGLHTTSPDPAVLFKLLSKMADNKVTHLVVEATAHGLDQYRFFGCRFAVSVLTNITHEHLDDFVDMHRYTLAKLRLFRSSQISILNADDDSYSYISSHLPIKSLVGYGLHHPCQYHAKNITITSKVLNFDVGPVHFITDSNYLYQVSNILAAYSVCDILKISSSVFLKTIRHFPEVTGRRQLIDNSSQINAIVDFAHTPNALKQTLSSLKKASPHRLIVIFGATGRRDQTKRPLMGKHVSEIADIAIVTSDDTRTEDINQINDQIISGFNHTRISKKQFQYYVQPNRQDAFNLAVRLAKKGDTIIACGKGHETSLLLGKTEYPWSDAEAFRTSFRQIT